MEDLNRARDTRLTDPICAKWMLATRGLLEPVKKISELLHPCSFMPTRVAHWLDRSPRFDRYHLSVCFFVECFVSIKTVKVLESNRVSDKNTLARFFFLQRGGLASSLPGSAE
ncbi:hypothetical protein R1flu_005776 [Riccia fluitans]|uniref:Uncharacterized protein n=1 Tax=Riccia fluitans TaxID=41844 RepID=A0ABD1YY46_9MARC